MPGPHISKPTAKNSFFSACQIYLQWFFLNSNKVCRSMNIRSLHLLMMNSQHVYSRSSFTGLYKGPVLPIVTSLVTIKKSGLWQQKGIQKWWVCHEEDAYKILDIKTEKHFRISFKSIILSTTLHTGSWILSTKGLVFLL